MSDLQLDWFVTTDWFKDGGRVVVGPFSTQDGAFHARSRLEQLELHNRYFVDFRQRVNDDLQTRGEILQRQFVAAISLLHDCAESCLNTHRRFTGSKGRGPRVCGHCSACRAHTFLASLDDVERTRWEAVGALVLSSNPPPSAKED